MTTPILFTIPNFITAGSGRAMLNIIERLDRRRFSPAVCVMKKGGNLDVEVERLGIPFIEAPFTVKAKPYLSLPLRVRSAARVFRSYRFALWHSFHYLDDYTEPLIARLSGAKAWVYTKKNMNWHRRSWYLRTLLATRVAAQNSDMMEDFFAGRRFRSRVRQISRGVDTERFQPGRTSTLMLRKEHRIAADTVLVGCMAHLVPVKGHPTLIEAVGRVPQVHLFVAGRPADEEFSAGLEKLAHDLGIEERVHFLGGISDVPGFWAEMDICTLPTIGRGEGCPVAQLEAMACGMACIATDVPGSRDQIEHERSGLIVPPEDVAALAEAIARLAESPDLRRALGEAARQRVFDHFSIEKEVTAHEALYGEVLGV